MKLNPEWRRILRRAWSIRLIVVAGLLSGLEVMIPILGMDWPPGVLALASFVAVAAAFIARLIAQKDL